MASSFARTSTAPTASSRPNRSCEIERNLGADVVMQFDHVIPGQSDEEHRPRRERAQHPMVGALSTGAILARLSRSERQALFPIVQGGIHAAPARRRGARRSRRWTTGRLRQSAGCRSAKRSPTCTQCWTSCTASFPHGSAALPHGRRISRGSDRGRAPRRRPVRLRGAHSDGAQRHGVHVRRPPQHQARRVCAETRVRSTPPATVLDL